MKRFILVVMFVFIASASNVFGENPKINVGVNYVSKYVGGSGCISQRGGNIQPHVQVNWKNGFYAGVMSFSGLDDYNDDYGDEWDIYGGFIMQNKHCKLDLSYWYYACYDLKKSADDINAFIARGFWTSCPGATPYFHLEFATPNSKRKGPQEGWHWRLGFQRSFKTRWIPIDVEVSIRGTEKRMYGTKPGISCGMLDFSFPIEFKGVTISPNLHFMKVNGDPDGPGKGFVKKNEMWWGVSIAKSF